MLQFLMGNRLKKRQGKSEGEHVYSSSHYRAQQEEAGGKSEREGGRWEEGTASHPFPSNFTSVTHPPL